MRKGIIYKITNLQNGKSYVGQTLNLLSKRRSGHKKSAFNKRSKSYWGYLQCAIRKYGWDNFLFEILDSDINQDKLDDREVYYIDKLDTFNNGYNLTLGGGGVRGMKGMCGKDNPMYGKKWSDEQHKKYSKMFSGINNPNSDKKVHHFYHKDYEDFYGTQYDFKCFIKTSNQGGVSRLVSGKSKSIKGWVIGDNKSEYKKIMKIYDFYNPEYGIIISTCKQMSDKYNLHMGNINGVATGYLNYSQGWVRLEDKNIYNKLKVIRNSKINFHHPEYGEMILTQSELIDKFKLSKSGVNALCCGMKLHHRGIILIKNIDRYGNVKVRKPL